MSAQDLTIADQLYGAIVIPSWLKPVVFSPELQRLREVRLINTTSPSCGSLSDARRFTHTMGVLHLASQIVPKIYQNWSIEEGRAFLVAALLHDIGTPAFGHLFEYQLASIKNWNHEEFVLDIIRGTYASIKKYHQIYYNNELQLNQILKKINVDIELVVDLVNGRNQLGQLLAGVIDLDNIDNVFRMAVLLGLYSDTKTPIELVNQVIPKASGIVFNEEVLPLLEVWRKLRKADYEILAFDELCLSGQAMLTDCFTLALNEDVLNESHWYFTDEQLLREFLNHKLTKDIIQRFAIGDYYPLVYLKWYDQPKGNIDLRHPTQRAEFSRRLREETGIDCSPYIFYDSGTFSKRLKLTILNKNEDLQEVVCGERSQSTIVSIFSHHELSNNALKKLEDILPKFLSQYGFDESKIKRVPDKQNVYGIPGQREIPF